jgi:hypothetical protein
MRLADLDLSGATVGGLADSDETVWPDRYHLHLKRFTYAAILEGNKDVNFRLRWLGLQPQFNTESYAQLAKVLMESGDEDGARRVLQRLGELQTKHGHRFWILQPKVWVEAPIGYGFRPILAIWYDLFLILLGWTIYRRSLLAGSLVPTDKDAYAKLHDEGVLPSHYPRLSTLMMSVENSLPLVKLGQADKWQPDPIGSEEVAYSKSDEMSNFPLKSTPSVPTYSRLKFLDPVRSMCARTLIGLGLQPGSDGKSVNTPLSRAGTSHRFVQRFIWIQVLLGWLFATLFVAGVSGLIKK